ncbi:MAG TPA: prepilin-type N-terminal cleavage/methylation domain-containing protein [Phycisphaerales bacterium]|nr:prepilin-type N-terminal cleavage/methylation domain-containing protein [Phycisphaerales bacterium]
MTRRGFTLLELMLAAMLGAMVAVTCIGLFAAVERAQRDAEEAFHEASDLSFAHEAVEKALRTLVMSDAPMPPPPSPTRHGADDRPAPAPPPPPAPAALGAEPPPAPRFLLEPDPFQPPVMLVEGRMVAPQRLELALRTAPVFVDIADEAADPGPERRRSLRGRPADPEEALAQLAERIVPGVRGAFELRYDAPEDPAGEGSWSLWWRQLSGAGFSGHGGRGVGDLLLAPGLASCRWEVFKTTTDEHNVSDGGRFYDHLSGVWSDDLPAFVNLRVETVAGGVAEWMFEVGWTIGPEPGSTVADPANPAVPAGASAPGATGSSGPASAPDPGTRSPPARPAPGPGASPPPGQPGASRGRR